jgi:hypothetical protein
LSKKFSLSMAARIAENVERRPSNVQRRINCKLEILNARAENRTADQPRMLSGLLYRGSPNIESQHSMLNAQHPSNNPKSKIENHNARGENRTPDQGLMSPLLYR